MWQQALSQPPHHPCRAPPTPLTCPQQLCYANMFAESNQRRYLHMASGNASTPEELLSDLDRLRRQARSTRHAYWFPLVLFGLLTCASVPFYVSDVTQAGVGVAILRVSEPPPL